MHNYSVKDVLEDGFDLSLLKVSYDDNLKICDKITKIKEAIIARKKSSAAFNGRQYFYASDAEVLSESTFLTERHMLSMIFDNTFLDAISSVSAQYGGRYLSWHIINTVVGSFITNNYELADKFMTWKGTNDLIKQYCVQHSIISHEKLISYIKNGGISALPESLQTLVLELCSPSDAAIFVDSDSERVRLLAFKKIGPLDNLDKMVKDPACLVRKYAVRIMAPKDERLALFISDRSCDVFSQALQKISIELVPMMLGSSHLKKRRIKDILAQRLEAGQQTKP